MNPSSTNNFPWELIGSSFTGNLTQDDESHLQQWLDANSDNKAKYQQLQDLWNNSTEDYKLYLMANETKAWNNLYAKLSNKESAKIKYINTDKMRKLFYQIAAASVILILIGVGYLYFSLQSNIIIYETATNEHKDIQLTDGTFIALNPATKITISPDYNKKNRRIIMTSGEALFTIQHQEQLPFIVDLGKVFVKDIGTAFNIKRENNQVKVSVVSGKVTFNKVSTGESREMNAGMSLAFNTTNDSFGEIPEDSSTLSTKELLLNFNNASLGEIIEVLQKKFDKTIQLKNDSMAQKRLTAKLEGVL